jgi:hypothetical protein
LVFFLSVAEVVSQGAPGICFWFLEHRNFDPQLNETCFLFDFLASQRVRALKSGAGFFLSLGRLSIVCGTAAKA